MNKTIVSVGFTESHLLMVSEILNSNKRNPKILIFDNQKRFKSEKNFINQDYDFITEINEMKNLFFGFAKPKGKKEVFQTFNLNLKNFINLIHTSSVISTYSDFGVGIRIEPNSVIAPKTTIGNFVNINRNVSIGHHCTIHDFVTINPNCGLSGGVEVGENTEIGIGVNIINDVKIGKNSIIGAGSTVTKNIPDNVVAYGSPCKIIRET